MADEDVKAWCSSRLEHIDPSCFTQFPRHISIEGVDANRSGLLCSAADAYPVHSWLLDIYRDFAKTLLHLGFGVNPNAALLQHQNCESCRCDLTGIRGNSGPNTPHSVTFKHDSSDSRAHSSSIQWRCSLDAIFLFNYPRMKNCSASRQSPHKAEVVFETELQEVSTTALPCYMRA
jgi:hypothetical protein